MRRRDRRAQSCGGKVRLSLVLQHESVQRKVERHVCREYELDRRVARRAAVDGERDGERLRVEGKVLQLEALVEGAFDAELEDDVVAVDVELDVLVLVQNTVELAQNREMRASKLIEGEQKKLIFKLKDFFVACDTNKNGLLEKLDFMSVYFFHKSEW